MWQPNHGSTLAPVFTAEDKRIVTRHLTRGHYTTFYQRVSHHRAILVFFFVDSTEPSKPIQCSERILFEVGGVLLNLSYYYYYLLFYYLLLVLPCLMIWLYFKKQRLNNVILGSAQVDEWLRKTYHYQQNVPQHCCLVDSLVLLNVLHLSGTRTWSQFYLHKVLQRKCHWKCCKYWLQTSY